MDILGDIAGGANRPPPFAEYEAETAAGKAFFPESLYRQKNIHQNE